MGVILTTYPPSPGMNPPSSSKSVGGAKKEETVCCRAEGMKNCIYMMHLLTIAWQFFVTIVGWLSDPFNGES